MDQSLPYQPPASPPAAPPPVENLNIQEPGFTQREIKPITWRSWLKLAYLVVFMILMLVVGIILAQRYLIISPAGGPVNGEVLLQAPYQPVLWKDFGEVFEPIIKLEVYYPNQGWQKLNFLLDSGALVSSLPREEAKKMGLSLAQMPRSTFGGFGGTTSFAYKSEIKVKIGDQEVLLPVVFTESAGTKPILGRSGFFERYNIYFNSEVERIEVRR